MSNQVIVNLFGEDRALVEGMDLYRAGRNDSSLKAFLDDLRVRLRQITRDRDEN